MDEATKIINCARVPVDSAEDIALAEKISSKEPVPSWTHRLPDGEILGGIANWEVIDVPASEKNPAAWIYTFHPPFAERKDIVMCRDCARIVFPLANILEILKDGERSAFKYWCIMHGPVWNVVNYDH